MDYEYFDNIEGYAFTPKGEIEENFEINTLLNSFNSGQQVSIGYIKNKNVFPRNEDGENLGKWPLYKCIFVLVEKEGKNYILHKGKWFCISQAQIDQYRDEIRKHEFDITELYPSWDLNVKFRMESRRGEEDGKKKEEEENSFNKRLAETIGGQCWDMHTFTVPEYSYGIEFCDVMTDRDIIHVKIQSPALNSHLLFQSTVSAELLSKDFNRF
ncbi:MAG: DUF6119 family protein [Bacteroidia bacterium]